MIEQTDQQPAFRQNLLPKCRERTGERWIAITRSCRLLWIGSPLLLIGLGCGIAPKGFRSLNNPAAIVRARSVGYGDNLPDARVVPALIDRLNDTDPVVRLSAHEELKKRTGQDFGFVPWGQPSERSQAVARWKQWWEGLKPDLARNR